MLKIGVIGLGDIAQKGYLPVLAKKNLAIHLCSRDEEKLRITGAQYRFSNQHKTLDSLLNSGIHAAFVHTATPSHGEIVEKLLINKVHVYVDKPLTYDFASAEKLVTLAGEKKVILQVGFNRRFAPAYVKLKELPGCNMIVMQKNRNALPGDVRNFIFDDFIHVVDTLSFLSPYLLQSPHITGRKKHDKLYHVVVQFNAADGFTAIGIMNRDSGTVHEKLEVFTPAETSVVNNLSETIVYRDKNETRLGTDDWESTLHKRGFEQIVDHFLQAVESNMPTDDDKRTLHTHQLCEQIVQKLASG